MFACLFYVWISFSRVMMNVSICALNGIFESIGLYRRSRWFLAGIIIYVDGFLFLL